MSAGAIYYYYYLHHDTLCTLGILNANHKLVIILLHELIAVNDLSAFVLRCSSWYHMTMKQIQPLAHGHTLLLLYTIYCGGGPWSEAELLYTHAKGTYCPILIQYKYCPSAVPTVCV